MGELKVNSYENIETFSRKEVLEKIFSSWSFGNLGLFIGSGFSKAATIDNSVKALNWFELIEKVAEHLDLEIPESLELLGISFPELASRLCIQLKERRYITYNEAKFLFKEAICNLTNWIPNDKSLKVFREYLLFLDPSWIITTNYDLVLEAIFYGRCQSLNQDNYLIAPKNVIPIYHIHGIRTNIESIVITQDDYIPIFRPNEYRQTKLAMLMKESTTLVLGYSLGDINVLSALDWSENVYSENNQYPHEFIQIIKVDEFKEEPYRDIYGNLILEIESIESFFEELKRFIDSKEQEFKELFKELEEEVNLLNSYDEVIVEKFKYNKDYRVWLIEKVSNFEFQMVEAYIDFFIKCMSDLWDEAMQKGNFTAYDRYLEALLDIVTIYNYEKMSPRLFRLVAERLDKVSEYITDGIIRYSSNNKYKQGTSFSASRTWGDKKRKIPEKMLNELYSYASENKLNKLYKLLRSLKELINTENLAQEKEIEVIDSTF